MISEILMVAGSTIGCSLATNALCNYAEKHFVVDENATEEEKKKNLKSKKAFKILTTSAVAAGIGTATLIAEYALLNHSTSSDTDTGEDETPTLEDTTPEDSDSESSGDMDY